MNDFHGRICCIFNCLVHLRKIDKKKPFLSEGEKRHGEGEAKGLTLAVNLYFRIN